VRSISTWVALFAGLFGCLLLSGCDSDDTVPQSDHVQRVAQVPAPEFAGDYLTRDVRDDVFYFVLPDRFDNGDPSNDQGSKTIAISSGGFDPTSSGHYHGGDLKGLTRRIDYLKGMGVTAIWLTPILRNQAVQGDSAGYHGYWPLDFTEIDPHLGTNDDLKHFIEVAHGKGIKVFFDIITNHTADVIKYRECHTPGRPWFSTSEALCPYRSLAEKAAGRGYTPFVPPGSETLKSPDWLNDPRYYHNQGDSTWTGENSLYGDFMGLDDIDTDNPEVVEKMIEVFTKLIAEFKPDGFRIDTVKHVNVEFWQAFVPAIQKFAREQGIANFFVFGEVYSGDTDVLSYYTREGKFPSVLDFAFNFKVRDVLVNKGGTHHIKELFANDKKYYTETASPDLLMNFVSNHDVGRLGYALQQAFPEASDQALLKRLQLAHALMFFSRGIPVIYYGDEQGFTGDGGDRGAREDMMPSKTPSYNDNDLIGTDKTTADDNFDPTHPMYLTLREYASLYHRYEGLRKGRQTIDEALTTDKLLVIRRELDDEAFLILFNISDQPVQASGLSNLHSYEVVYGEQQSPTDNFLIEPLSMVIFKVKN
jgi:glycosidase